MHARTRPILGNPPQAHAAPIMALERSPFFPDIILTVGDWSFQIWREGQTAPLFTSGYASEMYTTGACAARVCTRCFVWCWHACVALVWACRAPIVVSCVWT